MSMWTTISRRSFATWTMCGLHLFRYVTNQPPKANSAFHPSEVGKWVPASAGKAKAGIVHSVSGWTRSVQVNLWDPLRTCAIPERLFYRCVHDKALYKSTFTFILPFTCQHTLLSSGRSSLPPPRRFCFTQRLSVCLLAIYRMNTDRIFMKILLETYL